MSGDWKPKPKPDWLQHGYTFTHLSLLDPEWQPGVGQRRADAPKAEMVVTSVLTHAVYFGYVDAPIGAFRLGLEDFVARYAPVPEEKP